MKTFILLALAAIASYGTVIGPGQCIGNAPTCVGPISNSTERGLGSFVATDTAFVFTVDSSQPVGQFVSSVYRTSSGYQLFYQLQTYAIVPGPVIHLALEQFYATGSATSEPFLLGTPFPPTDVSQRTDAVNTSFVSFGNRAVLFDVNAVDPFAEVDFSDSLGGTPISVGTSSATIEIDQTGEWYTTSLPQFAPVVLSYATRGGLMGLFASGPVLFPTPAPEPAAAGLALIGIAGALLLARRRISH